MSEEKQEIEEELDLEEDQEVSGEEPEEAPPEPVDPELVEEARKYGWKPKEEFTLAPEGWVDADRYLELPSTQLKMQRDLARELKEQLRERDERLARVEGTAKTAAERIRQQERERYESQLQHLQAQRRQAAEEGDMARYDQLRDHEQRLMSRPPDVAEPAVDPEFNEYLSKSEWVKDPHAYQFAYQAIESNPAVKVLPPMKQIEWAERQVKDVFPQYFKEPDPEPQPAPQSRVQSRVDPGGLGGIRRGRGADDLPSEAKQVGRGFVEEGIYKTLDEYARDYFSQEAG